MPHSVCLILLVNVKNDKRFPWHKKVMVKWDNWVHVIYSPLSHYATQTCWKWAVNGYTEIQLSAAKLGGLHRVKPHGQLPGLGCQSLSSFRTAVCKYLGSNQLQQQLEHRKGCYLLQCREEYVCKGSVKQTMLSGQLRLKACLPPAAPSTIGKKGRKMLCVFLNSLIPFDIA